MLSVLPQDILRRFRTRIGWGRGQQAEPDEEFDGGPSAGPTETRDPIPEPPREPPLESQILRVLIEHDGRIRRDELTAALDRPEEEVLAVIDELAADDELRLIDRGRSTLVARPGYEPVGYRVT